MNQSSNHYPLFARSDLSAFWALFTDNLTNLIVLSGVCKFVFNMPTEIVFGRIVPGAAVAILSDVMQNKLWDNPKYFEKSAVT